MTTTTRVTHQPMSDSKLSSGLRETSSSATNSGSSPPSNKNLSHVPCKFYRQGTCQAGDSCQFSHSADKMDQTPCKYFLRGNCKFGSKCALAHILPDGRRINHNHSSNNNQRRQSSNNYRHPSIPTSPPRSLPVNMNDKNDTLKSVHNAATLMSNNSPASLTNSIWNNRSSMYTDSAIIDDDDEIDDDDILIDEEDFVPSSLTDLLTPQERQRRDSRREQYFRHSSFSEVSDSPLPNSSRLLNPIGTPDKKSSSQTPLPHSNDDTQFFMEDHDMTNVMT